MQSTTRRGRVAVVVPQYRDELTADEEISLCHLDRYLSAFDRYVVTPKRLRKPLEGFEPRVFANRYFESRFSYSALLLRPAFYDVFADYDYILLYQLDSLVFSDRLLDWCSKDIDFVGAPGLFVDWPRAEEIRNGGFSLRGVEAFRRVLGSQRYWMDPDDYWRTFWALKPRSVRALNLPRRYVKRLHRCNGVRWETARWMRGTNTSRTLGRNEDFFWSLEAKRYDPEFSVAPLEVALRFAFESNPRACYELNDYALPFGCHGWAKYDRSFWEPHLVAG
jgi:hypothetical protein